MMRRASRAILFGGALAALCMPGALRNAEAQNDPLSLGPGFVFYDDEIPPPPPKPQKPPISQNQQPAPTPATPPPPAPLSSEWIKANLQTYLNDALDNPTPDNVRAYLSLQKVMFDRAQNFAEEASYVSQFTPALNAGTYIPLDNAGNNDEIAAVSSAKGSVIANLSSNVGLWFFFKSGCDFCEKQLPAFNSFVEQYHLHSLYISLDGAPLSGIPAGADIKQDSGQAQRLGLVETPSIVMVWPPNNFAVISQGLTSQDDIGAVMAKAAAYMNLVPQTLLAKANPYQRGVMTPSQLNTYQSGQQLSPSQLSNYVTGTSSNQISNYSGSAPYTVAPQQEAQ